MRRWMPRRAGAEGVRPSLRAAPSPGTPGEGRGEGDSERKKSTDIPKRVHCGYERPFAFEITLTPTLFRNTGRGGGCAQRRSCTPVRGRICGVRPIALYCMLRGRSSIGRALPLQGRGCRFEPVRLQYAVNQGVYSVFYALIFDSFLTPGVNSRSRRFRGPDGQAVLRLASRPPRQISRGGTICGKIGMICQGIA
jgi:hypothetical protein